MEIFKLKTLTKADWVTRINVTHIIRGIGARRGESCEVFDRFSKHFNLFCKVQKSYDLDFNIKHKYDGGNVLILNFEEIFRASTMNMNQSDRSKPIVFFWGYLCEAGATQFLGGQFWKR